ncbi:hypothetical protein Tco_0600511 [Tanacetum coccineum]|uniref:Uncharacterized protein n=1 Tax=Tanacetum coccineum TaxID=301880 RepID=A0ABQ4WC06_9ASTR
MCSSGTQLSLVLWYHILERVNCVLRISRLYTSRLFDAACKKVMNLLKKELLVWGEKVEAMPKSAWTKKDQIDKLLEIKKVNEELRKVRWWEIIRRIFRHSDTERLSRSDEVLKLKNFNKDATLKLFKSTNQEMYEHVGPEVTSSQEAKFTRWRKEIMLG